MTESAKWKLSTALGLAWLTLMVFRMMTHDELQEIPLTYKSGQVQGGDQREPSKLPAPLVAKSLQGRAKATPPTPSKNIFAPLEDTLHQSRVRGSKTRLSKETSAAPVVVPAFTAPPPPSPPSPEALASEQRRRLEELAIQQAKELLAQYRFLGSLTKNGDRQAFLGKGQDIYIIRDGELLGGRIRVTVLNGSSIKLQETNTQLEKTLLLVSSATEAS